MYSSKKRKNLCGEDNDDGLRTYPYSEEQFLGHQATKTTKHYKIQSTLLGHEEAFILLGDGVCKIAKHQNLSGRKSTERNCIYFLI